MVAIPPGLQRGHQEGQQQPGGQDAEDSRKTVETQRPSLRLGVRVALQVAAAFLGPPLLLQDVEVAFFLKLQNPAEEKNQLMRAKIQRLKLSPIMFKRRLIKSQKKL